MRNLPSFRIRYLILLILCTTIVRAQDSLLYRNRSLPVEIRVQDLLKRMTGDEKFMQLFMIPGDLSGGKSKFQDGIFGLQVEAKGANNDAAGQMLKYSGFSSERQYAIEINKIQHFFRDSTRLGIPIIPFAEALHGLVMEGATAFPQSIGLAASWDTLLMHQTARAIAEEAKTRGIRMVLGPVLNIARDPRWGRVEETYGEDPFLTAAMGDSYITEFEKEGIIATPKHFAVNSGDGGRDSYPVDIDERLLEEIYFPAFRSAILKAGARSIMSAYNSLNGSPCTANEWLLNKKLKQEWHFRGFVISDACAVGGANVLHMTASGYPQATEQAMQSGLDVIFQTSIDHKKLFKEAFDKGRIPNAVTDSAVARVLRAKFESGLFDNPYVDPDSAARSNRNSSHRSIALQAARESIVLLKNEDNILPLQHDMKIAVIGKDAAEARLGGYSGSGINKISILEGIRMKARKNVVITYSPGPGRNVPSLPVIPSENFSCLVNGQRTKGLLAEYFDNTDLTGKPVVTRTDQGVDFAWTLYPPDNLLKQGWYSVRWKGTLDVPETANYRIGISGNDGYRLYINDSILIDNWKKRSCGEKFAKMNLIKNRNYEIRLEFYENSGPAKIKMIWDHGFEDHSEQDIEEAVKIAASADVVVIVTGINEGEFNDRAFLSLPGKQEKLIGKIGELGKPMVVVLTGGSAITMNGWLDKVKGVVDVWYPGEAGGEAVGEVMFGEYNPAGRLPITFPVFEGQLPLVYNHKPTGRGDDYTDLTGKPLFPFGYGLSYTTFSYENLRFSKDTIKNGDSVIVSFDLRNTGKTGGDEVCQLYIKDELASVVRPVRELKGFQRIHLLPNEQKTIYFTITPELLSMLDKELHRVVEAGDFLIMIGSSSEDIRLRKSLTIE